MTYNDPQRPPDDPEERLQADPMLRRTGMPWGWGVAIVATLAVIILLLLATNQEPSNVADNPGASPPATTSSTAPTRGPADAPSGSAERSTTGSNQ